MIPITINGQTIEATAGATVLKAAQMAGIEIPTLCDHPSLKPYGGCRLCVVEVEGARTLQAACTLPVFKGMVVNTNSPKVCKAREFVLTLLFSERNHFCMFCQKSDGDCELQNAAYDEGMTHWPLQPNWNSFLVDASHPYFVFDHNRCILCRRCVRACGELVGNFTLDLENRGASSRIVADYGLPMGESSCIRCGTCVQICPTGALINRQGVYQSLEKNSTSVASVCVGCSVGCGIQMVVRDGQLVRVDGDWNAPVNAGLLCELGRFESLPDDRRRLTTPLVRKNGALTPATWDEALATLADRLVPLTGKNGDGIAAIASTRLPTEALHAFKELFRRRLGSAMVTSIEEDVTTANQAGSWLAGDLPALKAADCVVVVGADLVKSHQVAGFFVKRNLPLGTRLIVIDPYKNEMAHTAHYSLHPKPGTDPDVLRGVSAALAELGMDRRAAPTAFPTGTLAQASAASGIPAETLVAISRELAAAHQPVIVYGKGITAQADPAARQALETLAEMAGARLINVKGKANSFVSHAYGLDKPFSAQGHQAVFLALGDDYATPRLVEALAGVPFLAVQASYTSAVTEQADVVLPVEMWVEQDGHYINLEGRLQQAHKALSAASEVRSNLAALQSLADCLAAGSLGDWKAELFEQVTAA